MIWRYGESDKLRYGINVGRDPHAHIVLMMAWRTFTRFYSCGVRIRKRKHDPMVLFRPLRSQCLFCDFMRDIVCAQHWPPGEYADRLARR